MKRIICSIIAVMLVTSTLSIAGTFNRPKGTVRFQELSQARQPLPSAELDNELNSIHSWLNNSATYTQNISEWALYQPSVTYTSASTFTVIGDATDIFMSGRSIRANLNGVYAYSNILSSSYDNGTAKTTVTITDAVITSSLTQIYYGLMGADGKSLPIITDIKFRGPRVDSRAFSNASTAKVYAKANGFPLDINATAGVTNLNLEGVEIGRVKNGALYGCTVTGLKNIKPEWFISDMSANNTTAMQKVLDIDGDVYLSPGVSYLANGLTASVAKRIYGGGTIQSYDGTSTILTVNVANFTLDGVSIRGRKLVNESEARDIGVAVNDVGFRLINGATVSECAYVGILFGTMTGDPTVYPSLIESSSIYHNGIGINTGDFEYIRISNNLITLNGWNNARSGSAPTVPANQGWGILGKLSNVSVTGNQIINNIIGCDMESAGGTNPDHNLISGNTINHNQVIGLILSGNFNNEQIKGNIILSNVTQGSAAGTIYAPISSSADMVLIDVVNLQMTGNTIGGGSYGKIPIFGHARCIYSNNILNAPLEELRHPAAGSKVYDVYGETVNSDILMTQNIFNGFTTHTVLPGSTSIIIKDNIENGTLSDDVPKTITLAAGWDNSGTDAFPRYWRSGANKITIQGSIVKTGATAVAFTLPAGSRPSRPVIVPAICNGAFAYLSIATSGDVTPTGAISSIPLHFSTTFILD